MTFYFFHLWTGKPAKSRRCLLVPPSFCFPVWAGTLLLSFHSFSVISVAVLVQVLHRLKSYLCGKARND